MDHLETSKFLVRVSAIDNRTVTTLTVDEWQKALWDVTLDVAEKALTLHRQESTDYLQPAHIRQNARRVHDAIDREARALERRAERPVLTEEPLSKDELALIFEQARLAALAERETSA